MAGGIIIDGGRDDLLEILGAEMAALYTGAEPLPSILLLSPKLSCLEGGEWPVGP